MTPDVRVEFVYTEPFANSYSNPYDKLDDVENVSENIWGSDIEDNGDYAANIYATDTEIPASAMEGWGNDQLNVRADRCRDWLKDNWVNWPVADAIIVLDDNQKRDGDKYGQVINIGSAIVTNDKLGIVDMAWEGDHAWATGSGIIAHHELSHLFSAVHENCRSTGYHETTVLFSDGANNPCGGDCTNDSSPYYQYKEHSQCEIDAIQGYIDDKT